MAEKYEQDIESARVWLASAGIVLVRQSMAHTAESDRLLDIVRVLEMCANLPGDMPLRIRCFPNAFGLQA